MLDPFRIQFLTVTLDSQVVLTIVGLFVAGLLFRVSARWEGLDLRVGDWWDVATAAVIGARLLWVVTHLDYYLRSLPQVVVIIDGGLHPVGLVLGAAYGIRGLRRRAPNARWLALVEPVAIAAIAVFLFERAGCALTTCGGGAPTDLPWALQRGQEWRQPIALYQVAVLGLALLLITELREVRGLAFGIAFVGFSVVELISLVLGSCQADGFPALGVALALYLAVVRRETSRKAPLLESSPEAEAVAGPSR